MLGWHGLWPGLSLDSSSLQVNHRALVRKLEPIDTAAETFAAAQ